MEPTMNLNEYQEAARKTAVYQNSMYPMMAIGEEVGELQGIFAKAMRKGLPYDREKAIDELGDVLWNVANVAHEIGITLEYAALCNIRKLSERSGQGTLALMERDDV